MSPANPRMSDDLEPIERRHRMIRRTGFALIAGLLVLMMEAFSAVVFYAGSKTVLNKQFLGPLQYSGEEIATYIADHNPRTGWPKWVAGQTGPRARETPDGPQGGPICLSAYGDSFVFGEEVTAAESWSNVLARSTGCRIANYGVPGFGTDQALITFQHNKADTGAVGMLGIYPDNLLRNVNQFRHFISRSNKFGLKPRFILEDGKLVLVPLPLDALKRIDDIQDQPETVFAYESFIPNTWLGRVEPKFPYTISAIHMVFTEENLSVLLGRPSWYGYAQPGHATEAMEVTAAIAKAFADTCAARGKRCFLVLFPTPSSIAYKLKTNSSVLAEMANRIEQNGMPVLDFEQHAIDAAKDGNICPLLSDAERCVGHFNAQGNALLAAAVENFIAEQTGAPMGTARNSGPAPVN